MILEFGGEEVPDAAGLREIIADCRPGQSVEVRVRRGGDEEKTETVTVVLGRRVSSL